MINPKLLDLALLFLIGFHLVISPFTKVEESFNIQACHDMIIYGFEDLSQYDHTQFPGAIQRSFWGAGLLSIAIRPFKGLLSKLFVNWPTRLYYQYLIRGVLGLFNGLGLIRIRRVLSRTISKETAFWYMILQMCQFHIIYYSSRTLPNFIALPLVSNAFALYLSHENVSFAILAFSGVVLRAEIGVFALLLAIVSVLQTRNSDNFFHILKNGVVGTLAGAICSYVFDSYFWGYKVIPEINSFVFNVLKGQSDNWGVEPWYAYLVKYLPNLFNKSPLLILVVPGLFLKNDKLKNSKSLTLSSLLYLAIISLQPHKEWRFIVYVVPPLVITISTVLAQLPKKFTIAKVAAVFMCFGSLLLSLLFLFISSYNYPGGEALQHLNEKLLLLDQNSLPVDIKVHLDVPACMTGVTLFGYLDNSKLTNLGIVYDKTEDESLEMIWDSFSYVISEIDLDSSTAPKWEGDWLKIDVIQGYNGINKQSIKNTIFNYGILKRIITDALKLDFGFIRTVFRSFTKFDDKLFIYERNNQT
ncbi:BA75_04787T0 [Komagataella pastoris]|uniref:Mannosyltransferase n=1 Tax=Komagataella pastoris TaxID=4922 RepID=A0A1B2JJ84_PICPA|nr:BA75_04787T0 [Komagataella pastoris]